MSRRLLQKILILTLLALMVLLPLPAGICFGQSAAPSPVEANSSDVGATAKQELLPRPSDSLPTASQAESANASVSSHDSSLNSSNSTVSNATSETAALAPDPADSSSEREPISSSSAAVEEAPTVGDLISDGSMPNSLRIVAREASRLTSDGLKLARKGATFSARVKLTDALAVLADALDAENHTHFHSRALVAGLLALREADDFLRPSYTLEPESDPVIKAASHSTPVLKNGQHSHATRLEALQLYYSYATCQLAAALGGIPEGSTALCDLGRLQEFLGCGAERQGTMAEPKAMALYQAAILVDSRNYRAANELGVLFAHCGRLEGAKKAFQFSASIEAHPEILQNLSAVFRGLGDQAASDSMHLRAAALSQQQRANGSQVSATNKNDLIYWVDRKTFVMQASATDMNALTPLADSPNSAVTAPDETGRDSQPKPAPAPTQRSRFFLFNRPNPTPAIPPASAPKQPTETPQFSVDASVDGAGWSDGSSAHKANGSAPGPISGSGHKQVAFQDAGPEAQGFLEPPRWEMFAQGEYIGPARTPHVPDYYLRVDDSLGFVFRVTGKPSAKPYLLSVGDVIKIGSMTMPSLLVETVIQPDGTIVLPQVGPVMAAGKSIDSLRRDLDERYKQYLKEPAITVTPVLLNKALEELRAAINNRNGIFAGQSFQARIAPNGTVSLPAIGVVPAQGLTLPELKAEIEPRYAEIVSGLEVTPVLTERAPRAIYVLGEVQKPGRFPLEGPTSVIQALALAGSWNPGGNVKEVIIFRRDEEWRLMCTKANVRPALYNYGGLAADNIWLRDSDIVLVPKYPIQVFDDIVGLWFTKGLYGVVPFGGVSFTLFRDLSTTGAIIP